ncbi:MAG: anion permease, partial [Isosphaeraceae bacterium]|nr:anion permease [Isosphaeraceae bacterium]
ALGGGRAAEVGLEPAEGRALVARRRLGLLVAPAAFAAVLAWPLPMLRPEAHRLAAVAVAVIVLWLTEAVPMPVAALIGAAACTILHVAPAREVFAPFADPLMFLFIGSFILARALFLYRLDRRLAFSILAIRGISSHPLRILIAFGAVTTFLSTWMANTAATVMMYAIALSILSYLLDPGRPGGPAIGSRYATGLLLMTTFGASVGGLATPIGAAPNLIGLGFIRELVGVQVSFLKWCAFGVPATLILFLYLAAYLGLLCGTDARAIPEGAALLRAERGRLGPWTPGQRSTLLACGVTITLWLVPGAVALALGEESGTYRWLSRTVPEPVAALIGAILLFLLPGDGERPALTWDEAAQIDWGVVLLFGGGVALGVLAFR